jgi:hypothetical protein
MSHIAFNTPSLLRPALICAALSLAACNDKDTLPADGDHGHGHTESTGRLVFGEDASNKVHVYDLDERKLIQDFVLGQAVSAVHASPGRRYAVVVQAGGGRVDFIDGGIWLHGDHAHADDPLKLALSLTGIKPAHYREHEEQAALFYDGEGTDAAKFELFTDASLGSGGGSIVARQSLPGPVHGIAEPRPGYVLAVDTTRSQVLPYELHGDHFHAGTAFATSCQNLHGGSSNEDYSAFGCQDGVLVIRQQGDAFTDAKIATPKRVTQVAGHPDLAQFAAFAGDGTLYVIDPAAGSATELDWDGNAAAAAARSQHLIDAAGHHLAILDSTGMLHVVDTADWTRKGSVQAVPSVGSGASGARLASSGDGEHLYISSPADKSVIAIDLENVEEADHYELGFIPTGLAWLGVAGGGHTHE